MLPLVKYCGIKNRQKVVSQNAVRPNFSLRPRSTLFMFNVKRLHNSEKLKEFAEKVRQGPSLKDFIQQDSTIEQTEIPLTTITPELLSKGTDQIEEQESNETPLKRKFFVETYGCQMNHSDTEIINSILATSGFEKTEDEKEVSFNLKLTL
jgi:hypothetical protein